MNRAQKRAANSGKPKEPKPKRVVVDVPYSAMPNDVFAALPWTPFEQDVLAKATEEQVRLMVERFNLPEEAVRHQMARISREEIWVNSRYQVNIDRAPEIDGDWPAMIHLSIKRRDKGVVHDWRDLQRIKNELVGPEHEGVELYPSEDRLVDTANQYHIWVLAEKGRRFPFGWNSRLTIDDSVGDARQRPRGA